MQPAPNQGSIRTSQRWRFNVNNVNMLAIHIERVINIVLIVEELSVG